MQTKRGQPAGRNVRTNYKTNTNTMQHKRNTNAKHMCAASGPTCVHTMQHEYNTDATIMQNQLKTNARSQQADMCAHSTKQIQLKCDTNLKQMRNTRVQPAGQTVHIKHKNKATCMQINCNINSEQMRAVSGPKFAHYVQNKYNPKEGRAGEKVEMLGRQTGRSSKGA